ncbi:AfsR/SARP family transcriptional regulator [Nocardia sp. CA-119907]|uniref:AfsR/SARP family transcriptional regulator n=1 Tax=Nocardia sp. CA-119907 TaxID=3239973 RepID=UPI003D9984E6
MDTVFGFRRFTANGPQCRIVRAEFAITMNAPEPRIAEVAVPAARLVLFGGFVLSVAGTRVYLPMHARRVLAYLSLRKMTENDCCRQILAERLWENASPERSLASLRTALWLIRRAGPCLLSSDAERVALADHVDVDVHRFRRQAESMLADDIGHADLRLLCAAGELLPGWDDDWLVLFREQLRLLRLHTLETVARRYCEQGHHPEAIDLILRVVGEEPLRESAHTVLIDAHLGAGNAAEARRQFDVFAANLWRELGLRPSARLGQRVGMPGPGTRR